MYEIAPVVAGWQAAGRRYVLARQVAVEGFGRRWPAQALAVADDGQLAGTLLVGLADDPVRTAAAGMLATGGTETMQLLRLQVGNEQAAAAGLVCGGSATLLLQRDDGLPSALWPLLAGSGSGVLVTVLSAPDAGASLLVPAAGEPSGSLGSASLDEVAVRDAARVLHTGRATVESWTGEGRSLLSAVLVPSPRLVVVGAGEVAQALGRLAGVLGWDVIHLPGENADDSEVLASLGPDAAVVVLSHDLTVAAPCLAAALSSGAGYVGAMGSRRTQAGRFDRLRSLGVGEQTLARIHGPAGLDIGARAPEEIAMSICAEILAERSGRTSTSLSRLTGPIHPS